MVSEKCLCLFQTPDGLSWLIQRAGFLASHEATKSARGGSKDPGKLPVNNQFVHVLPLPQLKCGRTNSLAELLGCLHRKSRMSASSQRTKPPKPAKSHRVDAPRPQITEIAPTSPPSTPKAGPSNPHSRRHHPVHPGPRFPPLRLVRRLPTEFVAQAQPRQASDTP